MDSNFCTLSFADPPTFLLTESEVQLPTITRNVWVGQLKEVGKWSLRVSLLCYEVHLSFEHFKIAYKLNQDKTEGSLRSVLSRRIGNTLARCN